MNEPLDPEKLAQEARRLLAELLPATVLVLQEDGSFAAAIPGALTEARRRP